MDGSWSLLLLLLQWSSSSSAALSLQPCDLLYDDAVRAFSNGDYESAAQHMERALSSHAEVRRAKVRCRLRCQDQHPFDQTSSSSDLSFFDTVLRRAACANACVDEKLGVQSLHRVSEDVEQDFNRRIPYNYLQLAYQKVRGPRTAGLVLTSWFSVSVTNSWVKSHTLQCRQNTPNVRGNTTH